MTITETVAADWANVKKATTPKELADHDTKIWYNTIHGKHVASDPATKAQAEILTRVFALLQTGIQWRAGAGPFNPVFPHPTSTLLSHGGRVMIVSKHTDQDYQGMWLFNWLVSGTLSDKKLLDANNAANFRARETSSHTVGYDKTQPDGATEQVGKLSSLKGLLSGDHCNYGMNIALGGLKGKNTLDQDILADGLHGHFFLYCHSADKKSGMSAYLIGCENKDYDVKGSTHTGGDHTLSAVANPTSAVGVPKWVDTSFSPKPGPMDCLRIVLGTKKEVDSVIAKANAAMGSPEKTLKLLASPPLPRKPGT